MFQRKILNQMMGTMRNIPSFVFSISLVFILGCSDSQVDKVLTVKSVPYASQFFLARGEWRGFQLPNQKTVYLSCIMDDKPILVSGSPSNSRTYYGTHPWGEDDGGGYIKAGKSKVIGEFPPVKREYTLYVEEFRLDITENHTDIHGVPVEVKITKTNQ